MTAAANYTQPQTLVHQMVSQQVRADVASLQPVIIGPQFDLKRYASEKKQIGVGQYNGGAETGYRWPSRPVGGVVDRDWVKVFVDKAYLRYWTSVSQLNLVAGTRNLITDPSTVWQEHDSWGLSSTLPARGVKESDGIRVRVPAANVDMLTQITGFRHDIIDATVGVAVADGDNQLAAPASGSGSYSFGGDTAVTPPTITVNVSGYSANNLIRDVYTVSVTTVGPSDANHVFAVSSLAGDNDTSAYLSNLTLDLGVNGATITFDKSGGADFSVGQTWEIEVVNAHTPATVTSGGVYTGARDSTYIVTVTRSGIIGSAEPPLIETTINKGSESSRITSVTTGTVAVGSYGTTLTFTGSALIEGDRYTIAVTAAKNGPIHTLVLAHSLPATVTPAMPIQIDLMLIKDIVLDPNRRGEPPLKNYTVDDDGITIGAVATHYDPEVVDAAGEQARLTLHQGDVYIQYRSLLPTYSYAVHSFSPDNITQLAATVGEISADNPIALGLSLALQNVALSDTGVSVLYVTVPTNDYDGYAKAIDRLVGYTGAYGLVPLTKDRDIQQLLVTHVNAMSTAENGLWRICFLNSESNDVHAIVAGDADNPNMASLESAPEDDGLVLTVRQDDGQFLTAGVRSGDILRINYRSDGFDDTMTWDEYIIDRVISEDSLKLYRSAGSETVVPIKIEIWRNLSSHEQAEVYGELSAAFANRRVRHVWPPKATISGSEVDGFYVCAALAGRRASVMPQQGLTNIELVGIDAVPMSTDRMNGDDLNLMASLGTWIVTRDPSTRGIITRHQLTTAPYGNLNECEDSIVTNFDSVSYQYLNAFRGYTGKINITNESLGQFKSEWQQITQNMQVAYDTMLGPQLVKADLKTFAQHPILLDRVIITVHCEGPRPFNNLDIYLVI